MQKTRAQNIEFWSNGGHFRDDNIFTKFVQKFYHLVIFEKNTIAFFDFGYLDIAFHAYIKELESITPYCDPANVCTTPERSMSR